MLTENFRISLAIFVFLLFSLTSIYTGYARVTQSNNLKPWGDKFHPRVFLLL